MEAPDPRPSPEELLARARRERTVRAGRISAASRRLVRTLVLTGAVLAVLALLFLSALPDRDADLPIPDAAPLPAERRPATLR